MDLRGVLFIVMGYLIGSLPMGVIVARTTGARDPRTVGSGRIGGSNALRAMGRPRAAAVALLDVAKGAVPVLFVRWAGADDLVQAIVGVAAVVGACRSIYLRFHGGRGFATGIGAMLVISPLVVLLTAPVYFIVIRLSRYISLGSLAASAGAAGMMALLVAFGVYAPVSLVYGVLAAAVIWYAHFDNIQRLLRGQERKFVRGERETR